MRGRSFQKREVHLECHIRADEQRRRKESKYQSKPRWEGDPIRKAIDQVYPCAGNWEQ